MSVHFETQILNNRVNFPLCLAPMVGLSHVATRMMMRTYLPEGTMTLWPTEMLSSRRLWNENFANTPEVYRDDSETGLVPQILGNEERDISQSLKKLHSWGAEGIDINMGCPVQKALKHNYGVSLMGDPKYAADVVEMTVRNTHLPVSVKLRAGLQGDFEYLVKFVEGIQNAGASWVCLHPRTAEQKRRGNADWSQIRELKKRIQIPLIGNGDIQIAEDVFQMLEQTNCNMVMSGRALCARPWMLWQVGEKLGLKNPVGRDGQAPQTPEEEGAEYGRSLLLLLAMMRKYFTDEQSIRKIRFYLRMSSVWLEFGHVITSQVSKATTLDEIQFVIEKFFASEQRMTQKTELRQ